MTTLWYVKVMENIKLKCIGSNIRWLRQQDGLTIAELASRVGIKAVPLGRIERSENVPSTSVLYNMSKEFKIPIDAFFSESIEELQSCKQKVSKQPTQINEKYFLGNLSQNTQNMVIEIIESIKNLEKICEVKKHANIPLLIPFIEDKHGIENLAAKVRQYMDIGSGIAFDYFELFERKGLKTISIPLPKNIFSFSYYDHIYQNAFFFINSKTTPERQTFSLVYELGRLLISSYSIQRAEELFPDDDSAEFDEKPFTVHRAARLFAASFLMPKVNIHNTVAQLNVKKKGWSYELLLRVKHRYGVSAQALLIRLQELDQIDNAMAEICNKKLQAYYEETGYKEPGSSKKILIPNGRLWDLLLIGESIDDKKNEIEQIRDIFIKWKLPYKNWDEI